MPVDDVLDRATQEIRRLFSQIELTPEEKNFVQDHGRQLAEEAFAAFLADPNKERMRPLIIALAIAATLGPSQIWEGGVDALRLPNTESAKARQTG
jgi:hypothetical protein